MIVLLYLILYTLLYYEKILHTGDTDSLGVCGSSTNTMKSRLFETLLHFWALLSHLFTFVGTFCDFSVHRRTWRLYDRPGPEGRVGENPVHGRHPLSQCVRIVAPILWNPAFLTLLCTFEHFWAIYLHFCHFLWLFWHLKKKIMCHVRQVTCHMSHVTFHLSLTPTAAHLPLLTPPLSTVDRFQIQKSPK